MGLKTKTAGVDKGVSPRGRLRIKSRREILTGVMATTLGLAGGLGLPSGAASGAASAGTPRAPSLKPVSHSPGSGRWARLADMPFPVQEIYPSPFWTSSLVDNSSAKALRAQRFNVIVNAGGIIGRSAGAFTATDAVHVYDPIADRWSDGPRLPDTAHHVHLVAHQGYLYALGGFTTVQDRNTPHNSGWRMRRSVYRLETLEGRWERVADMPAPQAESVCVSLNGFIHLAGGRSPTGSLNSRWADHIDTDRHIAFDVRRNQWFELASMSVARNSTAGAAVGGILYVIGGRQVGRGNLDITEAYDPLSNRWQQMRPIPQAQAGLAAAVSGVTIFVFGGEYFGGSGGGGGGVYRQAWAYDTREDRWRSAGVMPRPRHGLGAVSMNNALYIMGGAARPGGSETSAVLDRFLV